MGNVLESCKKPFLFSFCSLCSLTFSLFCNDLSLYKETQGSVQFVPKFVVLLFRNLRNFLITCTIHFCTWFLLQHSLLTYFSPYLQKRNGSLSFSLIHGGTLLCTPRKTYILCSFTFVAKLLFLLVLHMLFLQKVEEGVVVLHSPLGSQWLLRWPFDFSYSST